MRSRSMMFKYGFVGDSENTIFVLVADNGHGHPSRYSLDVTGYRIPCLFYAPRIVPARRVGVVAGQPDIAPTLLALLGGA